MEVILGAPRGFCAGVVRAIDIVEIALERFGAPIYVRHEIVHNRYVVETLRRRGAVFVEEVDEAPDGATVIFSAHGVAPEVWAAARERGLQVIDATCPLVTKVHVESLKYTKDEYSVIVIGHEGHPEVIGTMGQSPAASQLVATEEEAERVQVRDPEKVVALTQTTLSVGDTHDIMEVLRRRFPSIVARNDICYATTNRQQAAKELAKQVDLVLVIGAQNSSNCNRLREVAEHVGVPAHLIDDASLIKDEWLEGVAKVGVTSGASTPEVLVEEVIDRLKPSDVSILEVTKESVAFVLPKELRLDGEDKFARPREGQEEIR
ncbi:MAG: 4-hydroxy-3-methylbut-2-enyl diphosphate reductase [Dehalococcoidia bacterium]